MVLPVPEQNFETGMAWEILAFLNIDADCHLIRRELFHKLDLKVEAVRSKIGLANGTTSVENTFFTDLMVSRIGDADGAYHLKSIVGKRALLNVSPSAPC